MKTLMVESQPAPAPMRTKTLLELRGLTVEYGYDELRTRAVDGIDLAIHSGEILGLAGESGCGKTTVAGAVMQILRPPGHVAGGSILFRGDDLVGKKEKELRQYRWRNVSMVFQSAMNSLNPVLRVGDQFVDMMRAHERISKKRSLERAAALLGARDPRRAYDGAGRRRPARDPAAIRGPEAGARLRRALHHARPLAARRVRGPDRDHVRRRDRRDGA